MAKVKRFKRPLRYPHQVGVSLDDTTFEKVLALRGENEPISEATRRAIQAGLAVLTLAEMPQKSTA